MRPFPTIFSNDYSQTTIPIRPSAYDIYYDHSLTSLLIRPRPCLRPRPYNTFIFPLQATILKRPISHKLFQATIPIRPFSHNNSHATIPIRPFSRDHSHRTTIPIRPSSQYDDPHTVNSIRPFPYDHSPCRSPPHPPTPRHQNFTSASLGQPSRDETISFDSPGCMHRSPGRTQEARTLRAKRTVGISPVAIVNLR
jgi:hypothetical protein